jgi:hypothetical protein
MLAPALGPALGVPGATRLELTLDGQPCAVDRRDRVFRRRMDVGLVHSSSFRSSRAHCRTHRRFGVDRSGVIRRWAEATFRVWKGTIATGRGDGGKVWRAKVMIAARMAGGKQDQARVSKSKSGSAISVAGAEIASVFAQRFGKHAVFPVIFEGCSDPIGVTESASQEPQKTRSPGFPGRFSLFR